jgi:hypothetical protein
VFPSNLSPSTMMTITETFLHLAAALKVATHQKTIDMLQSELRSMCHRYPIEARSPEVAAALSSRW